MWKFLQEEGYILLYTALFMKQLLVKKWFATLEHPPHFPDLTPCDFIFSQKNKICAKKNQFYTTKGRKENIKAIKTSKTEM